MAAVAGATSVAGCSSVLNDEGVGDSGATDVVVYNRASTSQTVSITVTDTSAERPHTSRTLELSPGEVVDPVNSSKLPTNTSYTVEVTVEGGLSETFDWADPAVELAPLWIQIDDTQNIRFLLQAG
ncbi:MAG: hypothetical protein ABEJ48_09500 [Halobacteriales archaeon]